MATPRERALLATPIPSGRAGVLAPFQFVFTGEERLRVAATTPVSGLRLRASWRFLVAGTTTPVANSDDWPIAASATADSHEILLGVGALSNFVIRPVGGRVDPGMLFVRVDIIRGAGAAAIVLGTLLAGAVGSWGGRAWPGSPLEQPRDGPGWLHLVQTAVPAAGANPTINFFDIDGRVRIHAANVQLATSGVGAARNVFFEALQATVRVCLTQSSRNQPAGGTENHSFLPGGALAPGASALHGVGPLPTPLELVSDGAALATVRLVTGNLDAADQYTALSLLVETWTNPITVLV